MWTKTNYFYAFIAVVVVACCVPAVYHQSGMRNECLQHVNDEQQSFGCKWAIFFDPYATSTDIGVAPSSLDDEQHLPDGVEKAGGPPKIETSKEAPNPLVDPTQVPVKKYDDELLVSSAMYRSARVTAATAQDEDSAEDEDPADYESDVKGLAKEARRRRRKRRVGVAVEEVTEEVDFVVAKPRTFLGFGETEEKTADSTADTTGGADSDEAAGLAKEARKRRRKRVLDEEKENDDEASFVAESRTFLGFGESEENADEDADTDAGGEPLSVSKEAKRRRRRRATADEDDNELAQEIASGLCLVDENGVEEEEDFVIAEPRTFLGFGETEETTDSADTADTADGADGDDVTGLAKEARKRRRRKRVLDEEEETDEASFVAEPRTFLGFGESEENADEDADANDGGEPLSVSKEAKRRRRRRATADEELLDEEDDDDDNDLVEEIALGLALVDEKPEAAEFSFFAKEAKRKKRRRRCEMLQADNQLEMEEQGERQAFAMEAKRRRRRRRTTDETTTVPDLEMNVVDVDMINNKETEASSPLTKCSCHCCQQQALAPMSADAALAPPVPDVCADLSKAAPRPPAETPSSCVPPKTKVNDDEAAAAAEVAEDDAEEEDDEEAGTNEESNVQPGVAAIKVTTGAALKARCRQTTMEVANSVANTNGNMIPRKTEASEPSSPSMRMWLMEAPEKIIKRLTKALQAL